MSQQEEIKKLKSKIRNLKSELEEERSYNRKLRSDRNLYRDKCVQYFKWFLRLMSEGKSPCLKWAASDLAKLFNRADSFLMPMND